MAQDASGLLGRWRVANAAGPGTLNAIGTVDFIPCGSRVCGVRVGQDGACAETIAQVSADAMEPQRFSGPMKWLNRAFDLHAELAPEGLRLNAVTPGASLFTRSTIPLIGLFVREGPAKCLTPVG